MLSFRSAQMPTSELASSPHATTISTVSASAQTAHLAAYTYPTLNTNGRWIRLVRVLPDSTPEDLRCEMVQRELTAHAVGNDYTAVSYCWGSLAWERRRCQPIRVNGGLFMISLVVEDILIRLLELENFKPEKFYWIDLLSIDQDNTREKELQVSRMADIFESATQVIASLGPHRDDLGQHTHAELAIRLLNDLFSDVWEANELGYDDLVFKIGDHAWLTAAQEQLLCGLLDHPWFRRVWVLQEMAFAKSVLVIAGSASIDGIHFGASLIAQKSFGPLRSPFVAKLNPFLPLIRWIDSSSGIKQYSTIFEALHLYKSWEASMACDKVYALLSFCGIHCRIIQVDYSVPIAQLFTEVACLSITYHSSLSILAYREPRDAQTLNESNIPSWVPDWSSSYIAPWHGQVDAFGEGRDFRPTPIELKWAKKRRILQAHVHPIAAITSTREDVQIELLTQESRTHHSGKIPKKTLLSVTMSPPDTSHFTRFLMELHAHLLTQCGDGFRTGDHVCLLRGADGLAILRPVLSRVYIHTYQLVHFEPQMVYGTGELGDSKIFGNRSKCIEQIRLWKLLYVKRKPDEAAWQARARGDKYMVEGNTVRARREGIKDFFDTLVLGKPLRCHLV